APISRRLWPMVLGACGNFRCTNAKDRDHEHEYRVCRQDGNATEEMGRGCRRASGRKRESERRSARGVSSGDQGLAHEPRCGAEDIPGNACRERVGRRAVAGRNETGLGYDAKKPGENVVGCEEITTTAR